MPEHCMSNGYGGSKCQPEEGAPSPYPTSMAWRYVDCPDCLKLREGYVPHKFTVRHHRRGDLLDGDAFPLVPERDPAAIDNLVAEPTQSARKRQLRGRLLDALEAQDDPRMRGEGHVFDEYPYSDESSRGFYERFMRGESLNAGWVEPTDFEKEPVE